MKDALLSAAIAAAVFTLPVLAEDFSRPDDDSKSITLAVFGDWAYSRVERTSLTVRIRREVASKDRATGPPKPCPHPGRA